jgi:hypothetical protein
MLFFKIYSFINEICSFFLDSATFNWTKKTLECVEKIQFIHQVRIPSFPDQKLKHSFEAFGITLNYEKFAYGQPELIILN